MAIQIKAIEEKELKKGFEITVPYSIVEEKINSSAQELSKTVNLKGFRKGQVPSRVVIEKYGQSIMAEESDKIISEQIKKIIEDNDLKIALQPKIDVKSFEKGKDLLIQADFEIFPEVPEIDLKKLKIAKKEATISSEDIEEGVAKLLQYFKKFEKQEDSYKAKTGDSIDIDYEGSVDGEKFEGGTAQGHKLELGSKSFIDNFEDQLVGKKTGDKVKVKVKFPKEYHAPNLAGKKAEFQVTVNSVSTSTLPDIDDAFVKDNFGIESKEKLNQETEKQISESYKNLSKEMFKKDLFDLLNKKYDFNLPEGLVEEQLNKLWSEVEQELKTNPDKFKNDKEKNKAKDEKKKLASRMIRSGIILNEIAQKNKIEPNNDDMDKELQKIMQRYPGQEKAIIEYYQKNPDAIQQLRGSVIEERTIDYIMGEVTLDTKSVSTKEFDKIWKKFNES